jgi:hypothetical protein
MEALAAKKEAHRQANRRNNRVTITRPIENIKESPKALERAQN